MLRYDETYGCEPKAPCLLAERLDLKTSSSSSLCHGNSLRSATPDGSCGATVTAEDANEAHVNGSSCRSQCR